VCVLCVACANIANLLLARSTAREREIAVRAALGAGRRRILRQLLTESLMLASLAGAAALLLALVGTTYIVTLLPPDFPRAGEIAVDGRVLAFTAGITLLTSCVFGLVPAWRSAQCDLASLLNDCSRGSTETPRGRRMRNVLIVAELVMAFMLLAGACGLLRNVWRLQNTPLGFNPRDLVTVDLSVPDENHPHARERVAALYADLLTRIGSVEGVQSATAAYPAPARKTTLADFEIMERPMPRAEWPIAEVRTITPNYFRTMQIPMLKGRDFNEDDRRNSAQVVIVNETLARKTFGTADVVGKRIRPGFSDSSVIPEREIVGVVGDVRADRTVAEQRPEAYMPHSQCASDVMTLIVRGDAGPAALLPRLRTLVAEVNENAPLFAVSTMEEHLAVGLAQPRLSSTLLAAFAAVAVVVSAIGVYGVMAYSVAQRRHEIGIRLALGAQKPAVFRLVLGEGLRLIGWALVGGALCTVVAIPVLRRFSSGAAGTDGGTLLLVGLLLCAVALIACCVPARRAAAVDPLMALGERS
jgi:putative ABC transport system permease protein